MDIKILFDKEAINDKFATGWGLSFLINDEILFDTGENFQYLEQNAAAMSIDLEKIKKVVISHEHLGHVGGLSGFLKNNRNITVYGCEGFSLDFKQNVLGRGANLVNISDNPSIAANIFSLGQDIISYKGANIVEQALVVERDSDIILFCGCCHLGVMNIIEKAKRIFNKDINLFGGLHLIDKEKRIIEYIINETRNNIKIIGPSHCTGFEGINLIKATYGKSFLSIKAGSVFSL